jgi:hypothetical protein
MYGLQYFSQRPYSESTIQQTSFLLNNFTGQEGPAKNTHGVQFYCLKKTTVSKQTDYLKTYSASNRNEYQEHKNNNVSGE